jgi:hypothetical protein
MKSYQRNLSVLSLHYFPFFESRTIHLLVFLVMDNNFTQFGDVAENAVSSFLYTFLHVLMYLMLSGIQLGIINKSVLECMHRSFPPTTFKNLIVFGFSSPLLRPNTFIFSFSSYDLSKVKFCFCIIYKY